MCQDTCTAMQMEHHKQGRFLQCCTCDVACCVCCTAGNHLQHVTYVVSESFVVATKRVKHAIKSDIPSIGDHISKLVHIGKATVDKLQVGGQQLGL